MGEHLNRGPLLFGCFPSEQDAAGFAADLPPACTSQVISPSGGQEDWVVQVWWEWPSVAAALDVLEPLAAARHGTLDH